jgi:hypothetical protein
MIASINVEPNADPAARLLRPNPTIRERPPSGTKHCRFVALGVVPTPLLLSEVVGVDAEAGPTDAARQSVVGRRRPVGGYSLRPAVAEIVGWRLDRTASMTSPGSMPCR